jgi:hypothetical protein
MRVFTLACFVALLAACGGIAVIDPEGSGAQGGIGGQGAQGGIGAQGGSGAQGGMGAQGGVGAQGGGPSCITAEDCPSSGQPCLDVSCSAGTCELTVEPDGWPCDDGLFCTTSDACFGGVCTGGPPLPCGPPPANPCLSNQCDEAVQGCVIVPQDGLPCDDGNPCSGNGTCLGGGCLPAPTDCSALDGVCQQGLCGPAGCFAQLLPNGSPCDDGNACTSNDQCSAGMCLGGGGPFVYFSEDFANNAAGWTLGEEWQIGPAMASPGPIFGNPDPALDHTATADNGLAGVVIGGFASTMLHPFRWLESPPFDATADPGPVVLGFWRWLNTDWIPFMTNRVEVWNGSGWILVWEGAGAPGITDAAWTFQSFDVTAHKNAAMRVRFGFDVGSNGAFTVSGWNLDDVVVATAICP